MNPENLVPNSARTPSERRANAAKAGRASGRKRKEKADFKAAILARFNNPEDTTLADIIAAMADAAINEHNVQAATFLRDTAGQKPTDRQEQKLDAKVVYGWEE